MRTIAVLVLLTMLLVGCGTVTDEGVVLRTADPALSILVKFTGPVLLPTVTPEPPPLPTAEPEVVPEEETGEVVPDPTPVPPCLIIKGNISTASGEKIYHAPGQANYEQVKISEEDGEMFFCSEEEAVAAGWRKALR